MQIITLLTDFGLRDGYVGVMKGVIWGIAPDVQIADITHLVCPQNILEGALALGRVAPFFPPGTIHLAVVDPGVGTERRPIAAQLGGQFFVGPDNGLCGVLLEQAWARGDRPLFVHLDRPEFWLAEVSSVFHGRDIFAPVAAHLALGRNLSELGSHIEDPVYFKTPVPEQTSGGWVGQVIIVDHFGNLSTNLTRSHLEGMGKIRFRVGGRQIERMVNTFGDAAPGELVAMFGEADDLSVAVVNGNAAELLGAGVGTLVEVAAG